MSKKVKVGSDEVGTGAWAGPAYVVGFCEEEGWTHPELKDSKELEKPVIHRLAAELMAGHEYHLEIVSVEDIDDRGMVPSLMRAFRSIGKHFQEKYPECPIEIDGSRAPTGLRNVHMIQDGDSIIPHIMAAAIIAKSLRDKYMIEQAKEYPGFGWERNMGYGVPVHVEGLNAHGLTPLHRVSFKPVRKFLRDAPKPVGANPVTPDLYAAWKSRAVK